MDFTELFPIIEKESGEKIVKKIAQGYTSQVFKSNQNHAVNISIQDNPKRLNLQKEIMSKVIKLGIAPKLYWWLELKYKDKLVLVKIDELYDSSIKDIFPFEPIIEKQFEKSL